MAAKSKKKKSKKGSIITKIILGVVIGFPTLIGLLYLYVTIFMGVYGTMKFGICKAFLQQHVPFPNTLQVSVVWETPKYARIQYTHTDAFGQYRLSRVQCDYDRSQDKANRQWLINTLAKGDVTADQLAAAGGISPQLLMSYIKGDRAKLPSAAIMDRIAASVGQQKPNPVFMLKNITIDDRPISKEYLERFRSAIPAIIRNPPDLEYPLPVPKKIANYKR